MSSDAAAVDTDNSDLALNRDQVDVWISSLSGIDDAMRDTLSSVLNEAEAARWRRFALPGARDQYLVARALLRILLSRYAAVRPDSWQFAENKYGRPSVAAPRRFRDLHFSVSHTDGLVVLAIGRLAEIGIDVEATHRNLSICDLSRLVFSSQEAKAIAGRAGRRARDSFFDLWTLKEAYVKARGMGLSIPLDSFWFDADRRPVAFHCTHGCDENPRRWQFHLFSPAEGYTAALAIGTPGTQQIWLSFLNIVSPGGRPRSLLSDVPNTDETAAPASLAWGPDLLARQCADPGRGQNPGNVASVHMRPAMAGRAQPSWLQ